MNMYIYMNMHGHFDIIHNRTRRYMIGLYTCIYIRPGRLADKDLSTCCWQKVDRVY